MDVQTGFVYIAVVVVSAVVIALISMFGIKEKSYEEAIAEQRKLPDDLLLNKKDKNKEKKHKNKGGKKVKEKKEEKDDKDEKDDKIEHVQFEEIPQILPAEISVQESNKGNKKKGKLEKIKPILVNKDEPLVVVTELNASHLPLVETNHFDLTQPKDDLELIRNHSKENLHQLTQIESTANKSPKDTPTKSKKTNKDTGKIKDERQDVTTNSQNTTKETTKEMKEQQKETPIKEIKEAVSYVQSSNKEPKKTKKKNDILAQIGGDKDAVDVSLLMLFIKKAELSRSEIQTLIEQLLNKQLDNPLEHSEWTEGRADPVIKLKKQLAEKEKALADEHEATIAFQNKLKELRAEFNSERSKLLVNIKQFEEALNNKVTETQTLHTRMQHILESHNAEKQGFARQIEQLQAKVNEDSAIIHKMQEDQGQTQGHLQQELMTQRKQVEVQFTQMRDTENTLRSQLAQKHVDLQELRNQYEATCESSNAELEMLRQQVEITQNQLLHSEGQLLNFKETNDRLQDAIRQLEESRRAHADLDHRLKNSHRHEQELQKQVNSQQAELNIIKNEANETPILKAELSKARSDLMKLKTELSASQNEIKSTAEITALKTALANKEDESKKFQDECKTMQNSLHQSTTQIAQMESKLSSTQKEYDVIKAEFESAKNNLRESKNIANSYQSETQRIQEVLTTVQTELTKAHSQIKDSTETLNESKALKIEINRLQGNENKIEEMQLQITKLREERNKLHVELTNMEKQKHVYEKGNTNVAITEQGREHTSEEKIEKNNHQLLDRANSSTEEKNLLDAYKTQLIYKEEELSRLNAQIHAFESDIIQHHNLTKQLQNDLDVQKSKNNELRTKNWKVMEALSAAELRVKSNGEKSLEEITQKVKTEQEEITKTLLQRIFPDIKVSEKTHNQWLEVFEHKIYSIINELKQKSTIQTNPDLEKQNKHLQGMISHYKQIINDTEGMLNKLQSHIESEETRWQVQLRQKENEVSKLRVELKDIQTKLSANEKLQQKAFELETRLANAESLTEQANSELIAITAAHKSSISNEEKHNHQLAILEKLQEERQLLLQELQKECNKRTLLNKEVTDLRSVVQTKEVGLEREKKLVIQLQQEVSQLKNEICVGRNNPEQSMLNGPPTSESLQSELNANISGIQPSLASQPLITTLQSTTLKNTEFANRSITKSINASKSEQEIENSSLQYSSKSCHMTDYNTQANWNPMIDQQHKKPNKKRKAGSRKK